MSWSVQAIGSARAVEKEITKQFENGSKCAEPEETVRQAAKATVLAALAGQSDNKAVKVMASGSQSRYEKDGVIDMSNSLSITIEPIWYFVQ